MTIKLSSSTHGDSEFKVNEVNQRDFWLDEKHEQQTNIYPLFIFDLIVAFGRQLHTAFYCIINYYKRCCINTPFRMAYEYTIFFQLL